jgi:transcriptional regulator with XRE-family HTH domain
MQKKDRIKILRILAGYNQLDLANSIGIAQPTLSKLENIEPLLLSSEVMELLAKSLKVDLSYLIKGIPTISSIYWQPLVPKSVSHINALKNDIRKLLPDILLENEITVGKLICFVDGRCYFLLGNTQRTNDEKNKIYYQMLILSDSVLKDVFISAFDEAKIIYTKYNETRRYLPLYKAIDKDKLLRADINTDDIESIKQLRLCYNDTIAVNEYRQSTMLRIDICKLNDVFTAFIMNIDANLYPEQIQDLSKLFCNKCLDLSDKHSSVVLDDIKTEITSILNIDRLD